MRQNGCAGVSASLLLASLGCGGAEAAALAPDALPAPVTILPPAPEPVQAAPGERVVYDPEGRALLLSRYGEPPVELLGADEFDPVRLRALSATQRSEARGLASRGPRQAEIAEGQRGRWILSIGASECVTVIAHGGLGISEIDAFLIDPTQASITILGEDSRNGPLAVVGGQRGCVLLPPRLSTVEVSVVARRGSGPVLVDLYTLREPEPPP